MSGSSVYPKSTAVLDLSDTTQCLFYLGLHVGISPHHISCESCCPKLPACFSVPILVFSLGVLQSNFHATCLFFANFSALDSSLPCSHSQHGISFTPAFTHSSNPELVYLGPSVPVSRMLPSLFYLGVTFLITSCQSISTFAHALPIPPVSCFSAFSSLPRLPFTASQQCKIFFPCPAQWLPVSGICTLSALLCFLFTLKTQSSPRTGGAA